MILNLNEIVSGLVAYLDPAVLEQYGVDSPLQEAERIRGRHPFVCIEVSDGWCRWVALSSKAGGGRRFQLPTAIKDGNQDFVKTTTFVFGRQHWYAGPMHIFQEASACERTRVGCRNRITQKGLLLVTSVVGPAFARR